MLLSAQPHLVTPHGLTAWDWLHAGVIVITTLVLAQLARRLTLRAFGHHSDRAAARVVGRVGAYMIVSAGLVYALDALHVQIGPLIGALGIGGIALAFALQDILQNLVAGIILQAKRPIRHGDQVEVGSHTGTVLDIDLRNVLIRTYDGLDVFVPNRVVLDSAIVNYTVSPLRRLTLEIGIGYQSDLRQAQSALEAAARSVPAVVDNPEPRAWVTQFGTSSVQFSLLLWFDVHGQSIWEVRSEVAMAVKASLDAAGIDVPYEQRTLSLDPATADLLVRWPPGPGPEDGRGPDDHRRQDDRQAASRPNRLS